MDNKDKKENPKKEEEKENKNKPVGPYGWICPVCGKGLAPWVSVCGCVQPQYITTVNTAIFPKYYYENEFLTNG